MRIYTHFDARACLAQGLDIAGPRITDVDITALTTRQRSALGYIAARDRTPDGADLAATALYDPGVEVGLPCSLDQAGLAAWLDTIADAYDARERAQAEARAAEQARRDAADQAARAAVPRLMDVHDDGSLSSRVTDRDVDDVPTYYLASDSPEGVWLDETRDRLRQQAEARREAERAAKAQAERDHEAAKDAYITQWVSAHGDDSMRARQADGLLPRREAIDAIAAYVLDPIGPALDYEICDDRDCPCGSHEVDSLDADSYAAWQTLRARLPEGSTHEFFAVVPHEGDLGECMEETPDTVTAVRIHVPAGPLKLGRTIAL